MQNSWETVTVDNSPMRLYMSQPDGAGPISRGDRYSESRRRQRFYPSNDPADRRGRLRRHRAAALPP